jgi:hypothetical protein
LESQIEQIHVLDLCARLDFDNVPSVLADGVENICAGEAAVMNEARLEQRLPGFGCFEGFLGYALEIRGVSTDLDATRVKGPGQSTYLMALIKDTLPGSVGFGNPVLVVVVDPE